MADLGNNAINVRRILGTPNEENWPGVRQLPDYKPTFPQWSRQDIASIVPQLDEAGVDILEVITHSNEYAIHINNYLPIADADLRHGEANLR